MDELPDSDLLRLAIESLGEITEDCRSEIKAILKKGVLPNGISVLISVLLK